MLASKEKSSAVVAGHLCLDITPTFLITARTLSDAQQPGKLVTVGPMTASPGGEGHVLRRRCAQQPA